MPRKPHLLNSPKRLQVQPRIGEIQKLLSKVLEDEKGCWIWQGYKDPDGYGQARFRNRVLWNHRLFYALFRGPIPKGKTVDHLCLNTSCCNPWHLCLKSLVQNSVEANKRRAKGEEDVPF